MRLKDGSLFWKLPKRRPEPLKYSHQSHWGVVLELAIQMAKVYRLINTEEEQLIRNSEVKHAEIRDTLTNLEIPKFIPKGGLKQELGEEE